MSEKSAEMRHLEHEDFGKKLEELQRQTGENEETIRDFIARQADAFAEMRIELLNEVRGIERAIASKCEQDSAIIATQNRELQRADRMDSDGRATAQALAVVTENMRALKTETDKSLRAAHDAIRGHGTRIDKLERKGGKVALKVLYAAAGVAGTVAITLGVQRLLGR